MNSPDLATSLRFGDLPRGYAGLIGLFPLRPIHDSVELENATEVLDAMALHHEHFSADQTDYFDVLAGLVEAYEARHDPLLVPRSSPLRTLKDLLEIHNMTASELGRILGNRELGSKILRGERKLTLKHVRTLAGRFGVSADLFLS